jgi:hypothetical protein
MQVLSDQVESIDRLIGQGQFPISARKEKDAGCSYCAYKNICFRNEAIQEQRRDALIGNEMIYTEGIPLDKKEKADE